MITPRQTAIPAMVRVKPGALDRLGIYLARHGFREAAVFFSEGLGADLMARMEAALEGSGVRIARRAAVRDASFEGACGFFQELSSETGAVIGFGGGKALDVAKYAGFLARLPCLAVPTSLSNDGFCSPQSSLTVEGKRRSLPAAVPMGVVIDTEVCLGAPEVLWHSGVGDLVAKFTAVTDWKLAFHATGAEVDDFAALLSDASVYQFLARPLRDIEGVKLLGSALLLNGISMSICGSSRPASGSEHLISHALDQISTRPRMHGIQVGVAAYLVSLLQGAHSGEIAGLFERTGFWNAVEADPFSKEEWIEAARVAPSVKANFHTVLSSRDCLPEIERALEEDGHLRRCFS